MKKLTNFLFTVFVVFTLFLPLTYSTTWTVQVSEFVFTPSNLNVTVGDSIKWQWVNGIHTTTSVTIPIGAATWDQLIDLTHQSYTYKVTVVGNYHYKCTPHELFGMVADFTAMPNAITPLGGPVPQFYNLMQNYPNPFNPVTNIKFNIPKSSFVKLTIYDIQGGEIEVLVNQVVNAGSYSTDWDASNYSSGVYIYKLETQDFTSVKKMILVK